MNPFLLVAAHLKTVKAYMLLHINGGNNHFRQTISL